MSETEQEPQEPQDEPTPEEEEVEEEGGEPGQASPPAEASSEGQSAALDEKQIEKATKLLERERDRHAAAISKIMGDDATSLELCARCWELAPGFHFPLDVAPVSDEQRAAVLASLGMGANTTPELKMAKGVEECPVCDGWGELALPSKSEYHQKMTCPTCGGNGYVSTEPEKPAWTPQPLDPAAWTQSPTFGNGGQSDQWGRPLGHPHYGQDPALIGV